MIKSESIKNIAVAMAKFRKEVKQPLKDADNPFFKSKYVPLENVVEAVDTVASAYGLSFIQEVKTSNEGLVGVTTFVFHESGEWLEFDPLFLKPESTKPQAYGSAITYARRYSLSSAFGITSEIDDDGNEASGNHNNKKQKDNVVKIHGQPTQDELKQEAIQRINALYEEMKQTDPNMTTEIINQKLCENLKVSDLKKVNPGLIIKTLENAINAKKQTQKSLNQAQAKGGDWIE